MEESDKIYLDILNGNTAALPYESEPLKFTYLKNITTSLTTVQTKPSLNGPITLGKSPYCNHNKNTTQQILATIHLGRRYSPNSLYYPIVRRKRHLQHANCRTDFNI